MIRNYDNLKKCNKLAQNKMVYVDAITEHMHYS